MRVEGASLHRTLFLRDGAGNARGYEIHEKFVKSKEEEQKATQAIREWEWMAERNPLLSRFKPSSGAPTKGRVVTVSEKPDATLEDAHALPLCTLIDILLSVVRAIHKVHLTGRVYRRLCPRNVLLFGSLENGLLVRLRDWSHASPSCYSSPEFFLGHQIGPMRDWYSFGCLVFFVFGRITPWQGLHGSEIKKHVQAGMTPLLAEATPTQFADMPAELFRLMQECLSVSADTRPNSYRITAVLQKLKADLVLHLLVLLRL